MKKLFKKEKNKQTEYHIPLVDRNGNELKLWCDCIEGDSIYNKLIKRYGKIPLKIEVE